MTINGSRSVSGNKYHTLNQSNAILSPLPLTNTCNNTRCTSKYYLCPSFIIYGCYGNSIPSAKNSRVDSADICPVSITLFVFDRVQ